MKKYLSFVKFSHTIFALPFALTGTCWGISALQAGGSAPDKPYWQTILLVVLCMVFARSAAMGFNRYLDRDIDASNPRTRTREVPSGVISPRQALIFVVLNSLLFITAAWMINFLCFVLSPVALAVILGYSYTKRFTALCHLVLGLGLGLAPVGGYLAVTGVFAWAPVLLGCAVLTWVSGFDIIYALQDDEFDRTMGLNSIPAWLGRPRALATSSGLHVIAAVCLCLAAWLTGGGALLWAGAGIFVTLLIWQHRLVSPSDLSRVNAAFFTTNGIASMAFAVLAIADIWL